MQKTVLITGASTGIGRQMAARIAAAGHRVFGTSRKPAAATLDGFELLPLDVTSDSSVAACVQAVIERAGCIHVLINNAGVELMGALEETSIAEAQALFETNFFGVMRMTSAVLPHLRTQRSGLIINMSSLAGLTSGPFMGIYCASKFALEAYTEALWCELAPLNIRVALLEPVFFKSEIAQRKVTTAQTIAAYAQERATAIAAFDRAIATGPDPARIADVALKLVEGRSKRFRSAVGWVAYRARYKLLVAESYVLRLARQTFDLA